MLHHKPHLDPERSPFFNGEWFIFQFVELPWLRQVNHDIGPAFYFESEGEDDAFSGVSGVGERVGGVAETEGLFPFAEGFVVFV